VPENFGIQLQLINMFPEEISRFWGL